MTWSCKKDCAAFKVSKLMLGCDLVQLSWARSKWLHSRKQLQTCGKCGSAEFRRATIAQVRKFHSKTLNSKSGQSGRLFPPLSVFFCHCSAPMKSSNFDAFCIFLAKVRQKCTPIPQFHGRLRKSQLISGVRRSYIQISPKELKKPPSHLPGTTCDPSSVSTEEPHPC